MWIYCNESFFFLTENLSVCTTQWKSHIQ